MRRETSQLRSESPQFIMVGIVLWRQNMSYEKMPNLRIRGIFAALAVLMAFAIYTIVSLGHISELIAEREFTYIFFTSLVIMIVNGILCFDLFGGTHKSIRRQTEDLQKCFTFLAAMSYEEVMDIISDEACEAENYFEVVKKLQKVDGENVSPDDLERLREANEKADVQKKRFWEVRDAAALVYENIPETIAECAKWQESLPLPAKSHGVQAG